MNAYGLMSNCIVDDKVTDMLENCTQMQENGDKKHIISDDPLGNSNAPLAQNKIIDEEPFVGMEFEDDEGAYKFYCSYARKVGFGVRKLSMSKCSISAKMSCRLVHGNFTVVSFIKEHNHDLYRVAALKKSETLFTGFMGNHNQRIPEQGNPTNIFMKLIQAVQRNLRNNPIPLSTINYLTHQRNEVAQVENRENLSVDVLSWEPRAFLFHNFLSKEECEHLIKLAEPLLTRSLVTDRETGKGIVSSTRTSFGANIKRGNDEIVAKIEKRIAEATFLPVEHGEPLHVLRYEVGQKIEPHYDTFDSKFILKMQNGGQRIATFLMYLSAVEEGGETIFPRAKENITLVPWCDGSSTTLQSGIVVKPKMGDALLFWVVKPDGTIDPNSLHGGCPVIKGNKWCCTKFIRAGEFKC